MYKQKSKKRKRKKSWRSQIYKICLPLAAMMLLLWVWAAVAQDSPCDSNLAITDNLEKCTQQLYELEKSNQKTLNTIWVVFAGCLVFFMNAGFGMLEAGFCRQKNVVNILTKNLIVFAVATLAFWLSGFAFMFGNGNSFIGEYGFRLAEGGFTNLFQSSDPINIPLKAMFFFQLGFAGTAATIVSGAVAERVKLWSFVLFSLLLVGISYPITGHWVWAEGGWLKEMGFQDFAGSTVVHSVGGIAALVGAWRLGPRLGRYALCKGMDDDAIKANKDIKKDDVLGLLMNDRIYIGEDRGKPRSSYLENIDPGSKSRNSGSIQYIRLPMGWHNLSISTLGCMILWLGWFGFNPGSTLEADPIKITHILLTTNMAAATSGIVALIISKLRTGKATEGGIAALIISRWRTGKSDLSLLINGILAGLVSITASCAYVSIESALLIGLVAGGLVVFSVDLWNSFKIDDPVGAISVHLVCGCWGTLAVGIFSRESNLFLQLGGWVIVVGFTLILSSIFWLAIENILGIRVSPNAELEGLDLSEHDLQAYSGLTFLEDESEIIIQYLKDKSKH